MNIPTETGTILGVAGGALSRGHNSWAVNADIARRGREAEEATARILDGMITRGGLATVMHDLHVPGWKSGNIDHLIISGRTIIVIDSKNWAPGFYWAFGNRAYRGAKPVASLNSSGTDYVAKQSVTKAIGSLRTYLRNAATITTPIIAVHSSSDTAAVTTWCLRIGGLRYVSARKLESTLRPWMKETADPQLVSRLYPHLITP